MSVLETSLGIGQIDLVLSKMNRTRWQDSLVVLTAIPESVH
jgi:hypothetical protein